jgi:hypothetical protein
MHRFIAGVAIIVALYVVVRLPLYYFPFPASSLNGRHRSPACAATADTISGMDLG